MLSLDYYANHNSLAEISESEDHFIGRSGGGAASAHPPNRIHFFHFCIRFCQKVYRQRSAPPNGSAPPQQEILDLPLHFITYCVYWTLIVLFLLPLLLHFKERFNILHTVS